MDAASDVFDVVRPHHLFAGLDDRQFDRLCARLRERSLENGQALFHRGDPAREFYVVVRGRIELFQVSRDGNEKIIEVVSPGQAFAEAVAFMDRGQYPINARALSATRLIGIDIATYLSIIREDPDACLRLLADISRRLHTRLKEIQYLSIENATHRLVRYLLNLIPEGAGDRPVITLELPRQVIASRISVKPETLSRLLRGLVEAGIVTVDGRTVRVLDLEGLRQFQ